MSIGWVKGRPPDERPYVSLAEALTWIAFGDSITQAELRQQLVGNPDPETRDAVTRVTAFFKSSDELLDTPGTGHFDDRERGLGLLADAWLDFRQRFELGGIKARGRYTRGYTEAEAAVADVVQLTPNLLAAFTQLDASTGGIRRRPQGSFDVLWDNHPSAFDREVAALGDQPRLAEGYLMIDVEREGLIAAWPSPRGAPRMSFEDVVQWCRDWRTTQRKGSMDDAWNAFKADPRHAGITRDDVFRPAWRDAKGL